MVMLFLLYFIEKIFSKLIVLSSCFHFLNKCFLYYHCLLLKFRQEGGKKGVAR